MSKSGIEWTDFTWNPTAGCSIVSPGCTNCYAMRMAARLEAMGQPIYAGLTQPSKAGAVWTGKVELSNWGQVIKPLFWKKPRRVFVNSMSDLFHENLPDESIDKVFAVMTLCPQHTFQVLTKRAERMRSYLQSITLDRIKRAAQDLPDTGFVPWQFPLPNVWLGVSAERQQEYDERKEHLRNTPAAVHFFSFEPLLGPITADYLGEWAIVGGESGRAARSMHPDWARSLRQQCSAAGVPFFFKQFGEWAPSTPEQASGNPYSGWQTIRAHPCVAKAHELYPEAGAAFVERVGKKAAGRLLDGCEHSAFPEAAR